MGYIGEIISGVFALLVVWLEVRMTRDRKQAEKRAIIRAKESKLAMKMQDANLSLSLATAIAVERGETNGEMKTAREKRDFESMAKTLSYIKTTLEARIPNVLTATQKTAWKKWQTEQEAMHNRMRPAGAAKTGTK